MSETLAPQPAAAPASAAPATAAPAKLPGGAPASAADAFAAVLAASALVAESPPPDPPLPVPVQAPGDSSARTAPAEGAPAGGDSSEPEQDDLAVALPPSLDGSPASVLTALVQAAFTPVSQPMQKQAPAGGPAPEAPVARQARPVAVQAQKLHPAQDGTAGAAAPTAPARTDGDPIPPAPSAAAAAVVERPADTQATQTTPTVTRSPQTHPAPQAPTDHARQQPQAEGRSEGRSRGRSDRPREERTGRIEAPAPVKPAAEATPALAPQPVARTAAPVEPAHVERPVRLHELAVAAKTAIRVAAGEGRASARISLQPEELGRVEIHLRYEDGGVAARVTADSSAAASVLTAASGDLRRTLEAQGFTVLGLDVQQGGPDLGTTPDRDRLGTPEGQLPSGEGGSDGDVEETTTIEATSLPSAGSQVDVLA